MAEKKTSPWVWVLTGCVGVVLIGVIGIVAVGFMGYRWASKVSEELRDPVARAGKVQEILGAEEIPDGYHAVAGFSVPFLMEIAVLSDIDPGPNMDDQGFDKRGFIYVKMLSFGEQDQELKDYFDGKTDDVSVLRSNNINIDTDEILRRGTIEEETRTIRYVVQRGSLGMHGSHIDGLTSLMMVECPNDRKSRMAIWFEAVEQREDWQNLAGTPGDELVMSTFMSRFDVCH